MTPEQDPVRQPHSPIDLIEYGRMQGQIAALQRQVNDFDGKQSRMDAKLDAVLRQFDEARGTLRTIVWLVGGGGTAAGGVIAWIAQAWLSRGTH